MDLLAAGYVGIIAQAVTGLDGMSYCRQQLDAAQRNNLRIQGYIWCSPGGSATAGRLQMFNGFALENLWLDVEQAGLQRSDVDRDLELLDTYLGRPAGIYSGFWFWQQQGWTRETWWAARPLWTSYYDGIADAGVGFLPYGGWQSCTIKQFKGTSSVGSVTEIDLNIMAE